MLGHERGRVRQPPVLRLQPLLERDFGGKPEVGASPRRVGERVAHVALLHGFPPDVERLAVNAGNDLEELVDRDTGSAADVIGKPESPPIARRNGCRDGVGHEREVPRLLAVAVDRDGVAPERGAK